MDDLQFVNNGEASASAPFGVVFPCPNLAMARRRSLRGLGSYRASGVV